MNFKPEVYLPDRILEQLQTKELNPQSFSIWVILSAIQDDVTVEGLSELMGMSRRATEKIMTALRKKNLVDTVKHPHDRRQVKAILPLAPEGTKDWHPIPTDLLPFLANWELDPTGFALWVLLYLQQQEEEGWTGTLRQVGEEVGVRSEECVRYHLRKLQSQDFIRCERKGRVYTYRAVIP